MGDWALIPPEYEGWSFDGSRFPGYDDPEFDDFREYGSRVRRLTEDDRCDVHGRFLSKPEYEAGACFWCRPNADTRSRAGRAGSMQVGKAAAEPSEIDAAKAVQIGF